MLDHKLVTVITINYNQAEMTIECVDSILQSTYPNYKICLVDNGSKKEDFNKLKEAYHYNSLVKLLRIEKNCGYVGGVNHGLKVSSELNPDYFLIMNNDTIIDKEAIAELVKTSISFNQKAIVSGKVYHYVDHNKLQYTGGVFKDKRYLRMDNPAQNEYDTGQADSLAERDMLDDIFWIIPKKVLDDTGYYSTNFFLYAEQSDYARRAVKAGYKLVYTPEAKIWHKGSVTTGDGNKASPAIHFWRKKGGLIYLYRNTKRKYFYIFLTKKLIKVAIENLGVLFRTGDRLKCSKEYASLLGLLHGIKWLFTKSEDSGYNPFLQK